MASFSNRWPNLTYISTYMVEQNIYPRIVHFLFHFNPVVSVLLIALKPHLTYLFAPIKLSETSKWPIGNYCHYFWNITNNLWHYSSKIYYKKLWKVIYTKLSWYDFFVFNLILFFRNNRIFISSFFSFSCKFFKFAYFYLHNYFLQGKCICRLERLYSLYICLRHFYYFSLQN